MSAPAPAARAALAAALDDLSWLDAPPSVGAAVAQAVAQTPAPPCEGCAQRARCGRERLACADFGVYVTTGAVVRRARRPDPRLLAAIFDDHP